MCIYVSCWSSFFPLVTQATQVVSDMNLFAQDELWTPGCWTTVLAICVVVLQRSSPTCWWSSRKRTEPQGFVGKHNHRKSSCLVLIIFHFYIYIHVFLYFTVVFFNIYIYIYFCFINVVVISFDYQKLVDYVLDCLGLFLVLCTSTRLFAYALWLESKFYRYSLSNPDPVVCSICLFGLLWPMNFAWTRSQHIWELSDTLWWNHRHFLETWSRSISYFVWFECLFLCVFVCLFV